MEKDHRQVQYAVKTSFIFRGTFFITARNKEEAREFVENQCGMSGHMNIHTTLPEETADWEFPMNSDMEIGRIRVEKTITEGVHE